MRKASPVLRSTVFATLVSATLVAAPAAAQPSAFTGLAPARARIFVERSQQGFGPAARDEFGYALVAADVSGDGVAELVTGIPFDDCNPTKPNCGTVFLNWGVPRVGLLDQGGFLWEDVPGSSTSSNQQDKFGEALTAGDFNGDGRADLVVGSPSGTFFDVTGDVHVFYGLPGAIQTAAEHVLRPGAGGVPATGLDEDNRNARFGSSFAVGDFDGDGHDDLAIGAPDWTFAPSGPFGAGTVIVGHGHIGGLVPFDGFAISQRESGIPDDAESGDHFGAALAAGDFNGDGFDDLAIAAPGEDGVGAALVLFGSPNSLLFANHYWLGEFDLGGLPQPNDEFGSALTTGDFNGDGFDDLAIGARGDNGPAGNVNNVGTVTVLYGAPGSPAGGGGGFNFAARQFWTEAAMGWPSAEGDAFGLSLAAADFDGDGYDDLAVGAPDEAPGDEGAVFVLSGHWNLLGTRKQRIRPNREGYPGAAPGVTGYHIGRSLAAGDLDGDGFADLVIGMPLYWVGDLLEAGGEIVLYGSMFADGFESGGRAAWSAASP